MAIQIRDLDQTVIGNPAHDLIRLGLSLWHGSGSANALARYLAANYPQYELVIDNDVAMQKGVSISGFG